MNVGVNLAVWSGATMVSGEESTSAPELASLRWHVAAMTHTGQRSRNEDAHAAREDLGVVVVADGFSGQPDGDIAAQRTVDEIIGCFDPVPERTVPDLGEAGGNLAEAMVRFAIDRADWQVRKAAQRTGRPGMCSAVAVLVHAGPRLVIGIAGCVRVYRVRPDKLQLLTSDSPGGPLGDYPVGSGARFRPLIRAEKWHPTDRYVVCTSGVHHTLGPQEIRSAIVVCRDMRQSPTNLIGRALHAGARENLTVVALWPE